MRKVSIWEVLFIPLFFFLIVFPILAILGNVTVEGMTLTFGDPVFWIAVRNTLITAFLAALLGVLLALGFGYFYIFHPGTVMYRIADFMNDLPIALPHTVAGLALLLAFGRNMMGFVGPTGLAFTLVAVILAMFFVSYPLAARTIASAAEEIDKELISVARTLGDSPPQAYRRVVIPLLGEAIFSAFVLSFSRSLSEFAAVIMFGGNVPGMTQVLASYVFTKVEEGEVSMAVTASAFCILLSLLLVLVLRMRGWSYSRSAQSA